MADMVHKPALPSSEAELVAFRPDACFRCGGFLVLERYEDEGSTTSAQAFLAWHCVQCGEVIDPVIVANRGPNRPARIKHSRARLPIGRWSGGINRPE